METKDKQGYYVSSVHIKKYRSIPLDLFHIKNKVSNMLIVSTALYNMGACLGSQKENH